MRSRSDARQHGFKQPYAIRGSDDGVARTLRVRHQAHHIAGSTHDSRNGPHGTVGTPVLVRVARAVDVAKHHLTFTLETRERCLVGRIAAVAMRDRYPEKLSGL